MLKRTPIRIRSITLWPWYISTNIMLLHIIHRPVFIWKHRPVYISKHNVSETGFCLRFQVKPTRLGPIVELVPNCNEAINKKSSFFRHKTQGHWHYPECQEYFREIQTHRERFNLRTIFKTKHTLRGTLMKTWPVRDVQQTKQCVYSIPYDCGRCYIGETSRPLGVCIKEHKYNLS
jgi:hypothetical protein